MNKKTISLILSIIMSLQASILPTVYADNHTNTKNDENNNSIFVDKLKDYGKYAAIGAVGITAVGATIWAYLKKPKISFNDLKNRCEQVNNILDKEQNVPEINGPAIIVGDLHGDFEAAKFYCDEFINSPSNTSIVFLGDYIDRGPNSIEILALLFQLKIEFPDRVHLLCGNHERMMGNIDYGDYKSTLQTECQNKYPGKNVCNMLQNTFQKLPIAAIVKTPKGDTLCAHGGIPWQYDNYTQQLTTLNCIKEIPRNTKILDIFDNDCTTNPKLSTAHFMVNGRFNLLPTKLKEFLEKNNLTRIVRGHDHGIAAGQHGVDVVKLGDNYEFITLLSSPNFLINHYPDVEGSHPHSGAAILINNNNIVHISTITQSFLGK